MGKAYGRVRMPVTQTLSSDLQCLSIERLRFPIISLLAVKRSEIVDACGQIVEIGGIVTVPPSDLQRLAIERLRLLVLSPAAIERSEGGKSRADSRVVFSQYLLLDLEGLPTERLG